MDTIKTLVENLILIVVLTVFLEMLLPSGIMRRYVKVIMGLVVVVSVLQTASGLLHKDVNFNLPAITQMPNNGQLKDIVTAGQHLAKQNHQEALINYREGIERQVLALAKLNEELEVSSVRVNIQDNPESKDYGRLQEIKLTVLKHAENGNKKEETKSTWIEPVSIQVADNQIAENNPVDSLKPNPEQVKKLKETVANFYNLSIGQVNINY